MGSLFAILMAIGCSSPPTGPQSAQDDITDSAPTPTEPDTPAQVTDPGQVTDLIVTDSTGTTATLSFTQVDDGSGNPAAYAVRSHVGPMNWGAADEVTQGTCAAPLQGTAVGSTMSCTIEGLLPDVAYTYQVAAFRGTFQTDAVYGELSNVVPDMEDEPDQEVPPGFVTIVDESWSNLVPQGWDLSWDRNDDASIASVLGSTSVLQYRYAEGFEGGRAPAVHSYNWETNDGITTDALKVDMRWTVNSGWQGHNSYVNKIAFIYLDDAEESHFVIVMHGNKIKIAPQKQGGWAWLSPTNSAVPTKGSWNDLTFSFEKVAPSTWHVKWWLNGELNGDHQNVRMADGDGSFTRLSLSPTWGGTGDVKNQTDYYWWDWVRVSAGDL